MNRLIIYWGILVFGAVLIAVSACQQETPKSQSAAPQVKTSQTAKSATGSFKGDTSQLSSQDIELIGTVAKAGDRLMLSTKTGDYIVSSTVMAQSLDEMLGKQVKVTATLVESIEKKQSPPVIDIIEFSEIE